MIPSASFVQPNFMAHSPHPRVAVGQREAPASPPTAPSKELQVFANPQPERDYLIEFAVPEFTCNCPMTGQPHFEQFRIQIVPDRSCIDLKSLKM
jgi:7-cyano-7-deazaguanine reductase